MYVLCHTGEKSEAIVEQLEDAGYDAVNIVGGYRAFLRLQLSRTLEKGTGIEERTKEIERSLIKKFRKPIWRKFTKAVQEYELVQPGDKVIIMAYALMMPDEARNFHPRVVFVDSRNHVVRVTHYEKHGRLEDM